MRFRIEDGHDGRRRFIFTVSPRDYVEAAPLDVADTQVMARCQDSHRISEKLLGLAMLARTIEQGQAEARARDGARY